MFGAVDLIWEHEDMKNLVTRFVKDQSGAGAVEYVLLAAMIAVVIITGMTKLANGLNTQFGVITNAL
jgi:pilus assembly protein Flp/PilA